LDWDGLEDKGIKHGEATRVQQVLKKCKTTEMPPSAGHSKKTKRTCAYGKRKKLENQFKREATRRSKQTGGLDLAEVI